MEPTIERWYSMKEICEYHRLNCSKSTGKYLRCYQVEGDACMRCPKRPGCFDKAGIRRRVLASSCYPAFFRGHQRVGTPEYLSMMRLRKIWAEGSFSVLKREHCISKIRKRGILAATEECLLAAMALNLKRVVNAIFRYPQIYCSAGTTVGFSSFFAFVNRSLIAHYPGGFMYSAINAATPKKSGVGGVDNGITFNFGYIVSYNFNWHISLNICLSNIMGNKRLCWIAWIITYCSGTSNCCVAHYRNSFLPNSQEPQLYLFTFEF